jgi:NAD(P)-dependent dehydrogenase (short-subunit alcohol dehydrogenase family)
MKKLKGKVAVVTGAASGIGRELALGLAREGCRLAVADIDLDGLRETAEMTGLGGGDIMTRKVNVASREDVYFFAEEVGRHFGGADILINNAGVVFTSTIEELSYGDFERVMNINFWGAVYGTKAFLGQLKIRGDAHIVNVSSVYGLWGLATQAAYNAGKFALRGFTEALMQEMRGTGIGVSCVYPGGVKTNIVVNSGSVPRGVGAPGRDEFIRKFNAAAMTTPERAARVIIRGIRKNRKRIRIGPDAFLFDLTQRMFPVLYQKLAPLVLRKMGLAETRGR